MSRRGVRWLLLVCALLVPAGSAAAAVAGPGATAGPDGGRAVAAVGADAVQQNNSTVRHRDPNEVREEGSVEDVRWWLVGRLTDRLDEGAVQLSEGQAEQARRLLGDEYNERLDQLVDVAGETETTRTLRETRENQRETTDAVEEYRETYEEYREARRNGNNERARELGRDLERQSRRVNENAGETAEGYDELGNQTGEDFTEPRVAIENVSENVSETQEEVREEIFTETNLTASADGQRVSFVDPLAISGTLTTENGTAVGTETIELRVGNRTLVADTDADGDFTVEYRPVTIPANATEVTVEYLPSGGSEYLNSSANVSVDVETVEPNVTAAATDRVAYNETLTVAGRVSADGVGAPAPVAVYVGDRRVGTTTAAGNGSYETRARLPADVPDGERTVRAVVDQEGRGIERANGTAALTVEETTTGLTADAGTDGNATVRVTGRLTTADGDALAGRTVRIERGGRAVESVTTNASGRYAATLSIPEDAAGETVAAAVVFEGRGTNLERSSARATVTLPDDWAGANAGGGSGGGPLEVGLLEWISGVLSSGGGDGVGAVVRSFALANPLLAGAFVLGVVLLALAGGYAVLTGRGPFGSDGDEGIEGVASERPAGGADGDTDADAAESSARSREVVAALLERARKQVAGGAADAGVITAYAATRRRLADRGSDEGRTHWEFYRRNRDALDEETASVLRDLTEAYERAAFAPDSVSVDRARDLLARVSGGDQEGPAAD